MLFKKTSLGDFADVQGGYAFKSKDLQPAGFCPVVKIKNVRDGFLSLNDVTYVDEDLASQTTRFLCETGDVLISMTGSGPNAPNSMVGRVARVKDSDLPALLNQRVGKLVIREKGPISLNFLYYCLSSKSARNYLVSSSTGSANQANINADTIKSLQIPKISYEESVEIGEFLSKFDDKIELNKKISQTLEEIAKAIFKSWFVNFDPVRAKAEGRPTGLSPEISDLFPDKLVASEIGEIPKGWEQTTLSKVTSVIGRGVTPKYSDEGIEILNQKCIRNWSINSSLARVTSSAKNYRQEKYLQEYDCVINSTGVGTLGRVAICDSRHLGMLCDSHVSIVRGITPEISLFTSMRIGLMESEIENLGHGSTGQTELPADAIGDICITMPSPELLKQTKSLLSSFIERRRLLDLENETLAELRDTLLPKLISGELRIPDAENIVEEAGI